MLICAERGAVSIDDFKIKTLFDYGLSNAQAKIYLALLEKGLASVREVSNNSKVARPDTYRVLLELHELGLVEKIIGKPTMYQPLQIMDAMNVLNLKREKESLDLTIRSQELVKSLEQKGNGDSNGESGQVILIHGTEAIDLKLKNLMENTQDNVCAMFPWQRLHQWLITNYELVVKTLERKVYVRVITEYPNNSQVTKEFSSIKDNPYLEIRHITGPLNAWLRIFDGKSVLLTTPPKTGATHTLAIFANNSSILEMAQNYFNSGWFNPVRYPQRENKTNTRLDGVFENLNKGFSYNKMIFDEKGKPVDFLILSSNTVFEEITGFDKSLQGKKATKVLPHLGQNLQRMIEVFGEVVKTHTAVNQEHYFPKENRTFSVFTYTPEEGYFATIFDEITELKKAQKALEEKEEKQQYFTKYAPAGVYEIDCKTLKFLTTNEFMCKVTGYSKAEILSKSPFDLLDDESKEVFQEVIKKSWKGEKISDKVLVRIVTKNGNKRWVTLSAKITYNGAELDKAFVVAVDVTEMKEMEEALKKSEEGYRRLFANILEGFAYCRMILDENSKPVDFVFLEVNQALVESIGLKKELFIGKKASDIFPGIENNEPNLFEIFGRISFSGTSERFEVFFKPLKMRLSIAAYSPEKGYFALVVDAIPASKKN